MIYRKEQTIKKIMLIALICLCFAVPALAETLTEELDAAVAAARSGDKALLEEYRARCVTVGREVLLLRDGESREAFALGVNEDYSLRVRLPEGGTEDVRFGEVSLRNAE